PLARNGVPCLICLASEDVPLRVQGGLVGRRAYYNRSIGAAEKGIVRECPLSNLRNAMHFGKQSRFSGWCLRDPKHVCLSSDQTVDPDDAPEFPFSPEFALPPPFDCVSFGVSRSHPSVPNAGSGGSKASSVAFVTGSSTQVVRSDR